MGIDLKKLALDVLNEDVDLRILAMQTLLRMDRELAEASTDVVSSLRRDLEKVQNECEGDCRFFARQCLDHVNRLSPGAGRASGTMSRPGQAGPAQTGQKTKPEPSGPPDLSILTTRPGDPQAQIAVLAAVIERKATEARAAVVELLDSEPPAEVAAQALSAMLRVGQSNDVGAALPYLKHRDGRVRANAVEVVEQLAPRNQHVSLLSPLCEDPVDRVRANALKALGSLGEETVFSALAGMLSSVSIATRASAVYVLRHLKGDKVIELLWTAARDPSEQVRLRVVQALRTHKHPQVGALLKKLSNDLDISICEAAYDALSQMCSVTVEQVDATKMVERDGPLAGLSSSDQQVQIQALKEIEAKVIREARPTVITLMTQSSDPVLISQAIMALGVVGTPADANLVARYLGHPNDRIRANSVESLAKMAPREAVARVLVGLINDRDNRVRGNVIKALAEMGVSGLQPRVAEMLHHPEVNMRLSGVWAGSFIRPESSLPLMATAAHDPSPDVRRKVLEVLEKYPISQELAAIVRELTGDQILSISEAALKLFERLRKAVTNASGQTTLRLPRDQIVSARPAAAPDSPAPSRPADPQADTPRPGAPPIGPAQAGAGHETMRMNVPSEPSPAPSQPAVDRLLRGNDPSPSPTVVTRKAAPPHPAQEASTPPAQPAGAQAGATRAIDLNALAESAGGGAAAEVAVEPPELVARRPVPAARGSLQKTTAVNVLDVGQATTPGGPGSASRTDRPGGSEEGSLDDQYDKLDRELEAMGRKLYELCSQNAISEPAFSKVVYQVKRYEDMIKRRTDASPKGILERIGLVKPQMKDPAVLQLEFNLCEEYRKLGESAVELSHSLDRSFPQVARYYQSVEEILQGVRNLKDRGRSDGD